MMLTVADCPACEIQKEALFSLNRTEIQESLEVAVLTISEIRALRKLGTRLIFPILQLVDGEEVLARRMGVAGSTVSEEATALDSWYKGLDLGLFRSRNMAT